MNSYELHNKLGPKGYLIREEEASYNDEIDDDCKEFEDGSP